MLVVLLFARIFNYVSVNHIMNQMLTFEVLGEEEEVRKAEVCLKKEN